MVYLYAKAFPLGDRLPRYGGGGAQRQKGCGGPAGSNEGKITGIDHFTGCRNNFALISQRTGPLPAFPEGEALGNFHSLHVQK